MAGALEEASVPWSLEMSGLYQNFDVSCTNLTVTRRLDNTSGRPKHNPSLVNKMAQSVHGWPKSIHAKRKTHNTESHTSLCKRPKTHLFRVHCIASSLTPPTPSYAFIVCCTSWHLMYTLIVCCTSMHLKIVLSIVQRLILAISVVYGERVNLAIVSAWHLVL